MRYQLGLHALVLYVPYGACSVYGARADNGRGMRVPVEARNGRTVVRIIL